MRPCQEILPVLTAFSLSDEDDACDQTFKMLLKIERYSESCLGRSPVDRCWKKRRAGMGLP